MTRERLDALKIRRAYEQEIPEIISLVRNVVLEVYADLIARNGEPPNGHPARWREAVIAERDGVLVGVGLAQGDRISDLWVMKQIRGIGIGARLLDALEKQISASSFKIAYLRVVTANHRARAFYLKQGWLEGTTFPHERDGHNMTEYSKRV